MAKLYIQVFDKTDINGNWKVWLLPEDMWTWDIVVVVVITRIEFTA